MVFDGDLVDMLVRVAMFVLVQALVYLILSKSSNIFSETKRSRSFSFRSARSVSVRRFLAALSDMPAGGEPSPRLRGSNSPTQESSAVEDHRS